MVSRIDPRLALTWNGANGTKGLDHWRWPVEEPSKRIRLRLEETEGIALDVEFTVVTSRLKAAFHLSAQTRMLIDCTRMTQNGHWQGSLSVSMVSKWK